MRRKVLWISWLALLVATGLVVGAGCASSGPVEVLDDVAEDGEASCFRASSCVEEGVAASEEGRFDVAVSYFAEACERGDAEGCRRLARIDAIGAVGEPDFERAGALYRWSCEQAGDATSCHGIGELMRLGMLEGEDGQKTDHYFQRACELGEPMGCHDRAVVAIEGQERDEDLDERSVEAFERACQEGLDVGCVNLAYMSAAGRGTGRDHSRAAQLFEEACSADDWNAHDLAGLSHNVDPDAYASAQYSPQVACEQLEMLIVGGLEERVIGAMGAETDMLRACYDEARSDGRPRTGRVTIEVGVSAQGDGISPRIVDDEVGLEDVRECVQRVLSRHLEDRSSGEATYTTRFGISFLHPPQRALATGDQADYGDCDAGAIQRQVSEVFGQLQGCGSRHLEAHPDDPGAVVALWTMAPTGTVDEVAMETTVEDPGLTSCLEDTIRQIEIPAFEGDSCPVKVPFLFSDGRRLHFSVVGNSLR